MRFPTRGNYLGGAFVAISDDQADEMLTRSSPRDASDLLARVPVRRDHIDLAVARAREAWPAWAMAPLSVRIAHVKALRAAILERSQAFAERIAHEVGKPLWEARTEVSAALNKIDITIDEGLALVSAREMGSRAQRYAYKPLGVAAVLGPFNFPLHLPHGHVVPALLTGNTVVMKPSELTPSVGALYAECCDVAGFPAGVFNLVQGGGAVGAQLAAHVDVDAVMFTGSFAVGQAIKRATLEQAGKLLALEMGGRNPAIVLADADLEKAVHDVVWGAMVTSGQRCSGTAVALVERGIFERFAARALELIEGLCVGDPLDDGVFMGPMISEAARTRFLAALGEAEGAGVLALRRAQPIEAARSQAFVTPSLHHVVEARGGVYETEELFGPDLALELVDNLDHAVARADASQFGLSASVFTRSEAAFQDAWARLHYGCINWNAPTCGASSKLPFGGMRKSGNHRPAALFSTLYCTHPVASIEGETTLAATTPSPGFLRSSTH
jgi:succinylglutamic semialdehyde dehydrogenase